MTVIAACVVGDGTVVMAADSIAVTGNDRVWIERHKILRKPVGRGAEALVATAGDGALQEFARFDLGLPSAPDPADDEDCEAWAHAVAEGLTELAAEARPSGLDKDGDLDGAALLAHAGRLWYLSQHSSLRVSRFATIGCGGGVAIGALDALLAGEVEAPDAVRVACEIACRHDVNCRPPIVVEVL